MNWQGVIRVLGAYLYLFGAILIAMGLLSRLLEGGSFGKEASIAFFYSGAITFASGFVRELLRVKHPNENRMGEGFSDEIGVREAIITLLSIWVITCFLGALPLYFGGMFENFIDCLFESTSAITTTGSTAIPGGESVGGKTLAECSQSLVYWRSLLQGFGGLGIVVLFIVLLPTLGMKGRMLFRYESTGPSFTPIYPTARKTALALLFVYLFAIISCTCALEIVHPDITLFESSAIALSTISTGGFSPTDSGISGYNSVWVEMVVLFFMLLGGGSFALYFDIFRGRLWKIFDPQFVTYVGIAFFLTLFGACILYFDPFNIHQSIYTFCHALRYSSFQFVSCLTSTGFTTQNYDAWPQAIQTLMFISMYLGGMAGSTAGGIKIVRIMILWECLKHSVLLLFDPERVRVVRSGGVEVPSTTIYGVLSFFLVVVVSAVVGIMVLLLDGMDLNTAMGLSGCMLNNTGVAFGKAGFLYNCGGLSFLAKSISIIWMLLGRLEYYLWLTLLLPTFWRR